jgi:hypothetical protein
MMYDLLPSQDIIFDNLTYVATGKMVSYLALGFFFFFLYKIKNKIKCHVVKDGQELYLRVTMCHIS